MVKSMILVEERRRRVLPTFTGGRPVPQPSWGHGVAWRDLCRLQPLCKVVQQLQQEGLTGTDLV
jgi:hypothetical protein